MVSVPGDAIPTRALSRPRFYFWLAGVCALVIYAGFVPTYWLQLPAGTFQGSPLLHVHAVVFSLWPLFLLGQTHLAATRRIEMHRASGLVGISLATAMFILGFAVAVESLAAAIGGPAEEALRAVSVLSFTAITLFAGLVAVAIANIKRPETHKRLMLLATISILQAAIARIFFTLIAGFGPGLRPGLAGQLGLDPPTIWATLPAALLADLLIVAMIVYDIRTRGRVHRATAIGGAVILAVQVLRLPLTATPAWHGITDFLAALAG